MWPLRMEELLPGVDQMEEVVSAGATKDTVASPFTMATSTQAMMAMFTARTTASGASGRMVDGSQPGTTPMASGPTVLTSIPGPIPGPVAARHPMTGMDSSPVKHGTNSQVCRIQPARARAELASVGSYLRPALAREVRVSVGSYLRIASAREALANETPRSPIARSPIPTRSMND